MKKKTFTDEQIVSILRGFEASGKTIKEYCREKIRAKGRFTNGETDSGQWKFLRFVSIGNYSRKMPALKDCLPNAIWKLM